MRFFSLTLLAVFGIAMFAAASLVWDRRKQLANASLKQLGRANRKKAAGAEGNAEGEENPEGTDGTRVAVAERDPARSKNQRYAPHWVALGLVILGMVMVIGACAGMLNF
jgi:hypothetical protein